MSELTLVTIPSYLEATPDHPDMHFQRVVGVTPPQAPTLIEYGYTARTGEQEEAVTFPGSLAERITDFYEQTLAKEPGERPYYDCHMFAFYALQKVQKLALAKRMDIDAMVAVSSIDTLALGEPYVTTTKNNAISHSILGVQKPHKNLSVIGSGMPLVISGNRDIMRLYGARKLYHATPGKVEF